MKYFISILLFLFPTWVVAPFARFVGCSFGKGVKIGFSIVLADHLYMGNCVTIGHFNLIIVRRLVAYDRVKIGRGNIIKGPLSIRLLALASLGNRNKVIRGPSPEVVCWGGVLTLKLGARITSDHILDLTRSVQLGEYSIIAGNATQVWTHGYIHDAIGPGRYRVDGKVIIGNNVYIGSRCLINLGVIINGPATIGGGTVISRTLPDPGLYVGAKIRHLDAVNAPESRQDLILVTDFRLCERVYLKN